MNLELRNPLAFFDLETTGINVVKDRIVEISILKVMPNGEKIIKTKKVNPTIPIPAETTKIHGISDEDVKDAPTFKELAKEIAKFLEGADLAGYNMLRFDVPLLVEEFLRVGINFDVSSRKLIDVQRLFYLMEPRTLTAAYKFYCDKSLEGAHSAEVDTVATYEVLDAQIQRYKDVEIKDNNGKLYDPIKNDMGALHDLTASKMVDLSGRMVYNSEGEVVFNFGKHKNKPVLEVLKKEPNYYDWMMRSDFSLNTKQKLTEVKLSQFNSKK